MVPSRSARGTSHGMFNDMQPFDNSAVLEFLQRGCNNLEKDSKQLAACAGGAHSPGEGGARFACTTPSDFSIFHVF